MERFSKPDFPFPASLLTKRDPTACHVPLKSLIIELSYLIHSMAVLLAKADNSYLAL